MFIVAKSKARLHRLQIGRRNELEAEVHDGLTDGMEVIVYPSDVIQDGVRGRHR